MPTLSRRQLLTSAAAAAALAVAPSASACPTMNRVLAIFLKGGFSPWRSFWNESAFYDLEDAPLWLDFGAVFRPTTLAPGLHDGRLGGGGRPIGTSSLFSKLRVVVMSHDLEPHEASVPYALTGTR